MNGSLFSGMEPGWHVAHCDGGSRGNPGPAGFGAVIEGPDGQIAARLGEYLGKQTNNYAEYAGLLAVLEWALAHGVRQLKVISDSELMVNQMKGRYKVGSPTLRPLWEEAKRRAAKLDKFQMGHTLRGGNKEADRLANEAMDRGMGKKPGTSAGGQGASSREQGTGFRSQVPDAKPAIPIAERADAVPRGQRQVFEGLVKGGVVHLIEGELPDGILVKVIRE